MIKIFYKKGRYLMAIAFHKTHYVKKHDDLANQFLGNQINFRIL